MHRSLPLLLLLLAACEPIPDQPFITSAAVACEETSGLWTLDVEVDHEGDPQLVESVFADIALYLLDEASETAELQYVGSVELEREGNVRWGEEVGPGDSPLECGFDGDYHVLFVAEDEGGLQAAAELIFDGFGQPL